MDILVKAQQWQTFVSSEENLSSFEQCLRHYHTLYQDESLPIAWTPDEATLERAHVTELQRTLGLSSYQELYQWSVQHKAAFWEAAIQRLEIHFNQPYQQILNTAQGLENPRWLPGARLNIVESCFQASDDKVALIVEDEAQKRQTWTYQELRTLVHQVASGLQRLGLQPQDRIVLYMPLGMEAVVAYLGIIQAGMVAVLVADSFTANELKSRTNIAQAQAIYHRRPVSLQWQTTQRIRESESGGGAPYRGRHHFRYYRASSRRPSLGRLPGRNPSRHAHRRALRHHWYLIFFRDYKRTQSHSLDAPHAHQVRYRRLLSPRRTPRRRRYLDNRHGLDDGSLDDLRRADEPRYAGPVYRFGGYGSFRSVCRA